MAKNLCAKRRTREDPYEVWEGQGWIYLVLKKYQADDSKPYARAMVDCLNPAFGAWTGPTDCPIADYRTFCVRTDLPISFTNGLKVM